MVQPTKPWFKYTVRAGKFSAMPVSWEGWLALASFVIVSIALIFTLNSLFVDLGAIVIVGITLPLMFGGFWGLSKLIKAKGFESEN